MFDKIYVQKTDTTQISGYESLGYRVNCKCGYAWFNTKFCKTKRETIESWNRMVEDGNL